MTYRREKEVMREAMKILSREDCTITQFASRINKNHTNSKQILKKLVDEGIVTTVEKRSSVKNQICVHYQASSPNSSLTETEQ